MSSIKPTCRLAFWLLLAASLNLDSGPALTTPVWSASPDAPPIREAKQPKEDDAAWDKLILDRLKDGGLNYPELPFIITAEHVEGTRLLDFRFMYRSPTDKDKEITGRAREAEVRLDIERRQILVLATDGDYLVGRAVDRIYDQSRIWVLELPKANAFLQKKPAESPKKAMAKRLSPEGKKLMQKDWRELDPNAHVGAEALLEFVFGPKCKDAHRSICLLLNDGKCAITADDFEIKDGGTRLLFKPCTIARLTEKSGGPAVIKTPSALMHLDRPISSLQQLAYRKILSVECEDGLRLTFDEPAK